MQAWPTAPWLPAWRSWAAHQWYSVRASLTHSLPPRPINGRRWSNSPARKSIDGGMEWQIPQQPLSSVASEVDRSGPGMRNEFLKLGSGNVLHGENCFRAALSRAPAEAATPLHRANKLGSERRPHARPRNEEQIPRNWEHIPRVSLDGVLTNVLSYFVAESNT
jgi:hypothetical protein